MPRPRTRGPNVQFRLPLHLHEVLVQRSEARGETPSEYVERNVVRALLDEHKDLVAGKLSGAGESTPPDEASDARVSSRTSTPPGHLEPGACAHASTRFDDAAGARVCKRCGAHLRPDGTWRVP